MRANASDYRKAAAFRGPCLQYQRLCSQSSSLFTTKIQWGILWRSQACAVQVNAFRGDADRAIVEGDSAFQARVNAAPRPSSRRAMRSLSRMSALYAEASPSTCIRKARLYTASIPACLRIAAPKDGVVARPKAQPASGRDSI